MSARVFDLEIIQTKNKNTEKVNGIFLPIWRSWDSKYKISPDMVYFSTIYPGEMKGPHLHKKRTGYITCLSGESVLVLKENNQYEEIICKAIKPQTIEVLPNVGLLIINIGKEIAALLNICNPAWHPDNQDNYIADFSDYDLSKWQLNRS